MLARDARYPAVGVYEEWWGLPPPFHRHHHHHALVRLVAPPANGSGIQGDRNKTETVP